MASRLWLKAASEPKMVAQLEASHQALSCSRPATIALMAAIFPVNQFFRQYQCQRTVAVGKMKQRRIFLRQGFVRVEILKASADTKVNKKFDGRNRLNDIVFAVKMLVLYMMVWAIFGSSTLRSSISMINPVSVISFAV